LVADAYSNVNVSASVGVSVGASANVNVGVNYADASYTGVSFFYFCVVCVFI
jgi:hypothetical protein